MGCAPGGRSRLAEELMRGNDCNSEGKYRIPGAYHRLGEELSQKGNSGAISEIDDNLNRS